MDKTKGTQPNDSALSRRFRRSPLLNSELYG